MTAFDPSKVVVSQRPATSDDLEAMQAEVRDINDQMLGDGQRYVDGGRYDMRGSGIASGDTEQPNVPRRFAEPEPRMDEPLVAGEQATVEQDQNWRQMYGRSENEKGQYRRGFEEALAELQQARADLTALRTMQMQTQQQTPAQQNDIPENFFAGKDEHDIVEVGEVNRILRTVVAPAVLQVYQQQQALQQAQLVAAKTTAGITPALEQQLSTAHPWLNGIADPFMRLEAMRTTLSQRASQASAPQQSQPRQVLQDPAQAAARRVTYVETGAPNQPKDDEQSLMQRVATEFYSAKTSTDKRAVLQKYGVLQVNDYGPDYYTR